jgi:hypothetical protein
MPSLPRIRVWRDSQRRSARRDMKRGGKRIDVLARLVRFLGQTGVKMQCERGGAGTRRAILNNMATPHFLWNMRLIMQDC